jgi:hypothetical protein
MHISMDEGYILMCAVRYQLPRSTYGSGIICDYIRKNIGRILYVDKMLLIKEIATALDTEGVVADIDRIVWQAALDILRND